MVLKTFCELFKDCDFSTAVGFEAFLDEFLLQGIFTYDRNITLTANHRNFGIVLRSLVELRLNVYDGQHRFTLMAFFLTGYFEPLQVIPLQTMTWAKFNLGQGRRATEFADLQLWLQLTMNVGEPFNALGPEMFPLTKMPGILTTAGLVITDAQTNPTDLQWSEVVTKFFALHEPARITPFGFHNYWMKGKSTVKSTGSYENRQVFVANMASIAFTFTSQLLLIRTHGLLLK